MDDIGQRPLDYYVTAKGGKRVDMSFFKTLFYQACVAFFFLVEHVSRTRVPVPQALRERILGE